MSMQVAPAPGRRRLNRGSEHVRLRLVEAAITVFAAEGFEGASTRTIAEMADAHQSQINYHFESKEVLWQAAMEGLLIEMDKAITVHTREVDADDVRAMFEATVRGIVEFAALRPELNRIMIHEGTAPGPRLRWLTETHVERRFTNLKNLWESVVEAGHAMPIRADIVYYMLVGAASLIYANAPEAELLGVDTQDPQLVTEHVDALIAIFLNPR